MKRSGPLPRYTRLEPGPPPQRSAWMPKVSKKRRRENRERRAMVDVQWPDGVRPRCVVPWCTELADDLHEPLPRGRGGSITDPNCGVPVCRCHHGEIQKGPAWAYALLLMVHSWDRRSLAELAEARRKALEEAALEIAEQGFLSASWAGEASWAN